MSTAEFSAPLRRFVWKEYRTLRGLWLGVFALAVLIDWLLGVVLSGGTDWPALRVSVGLAAATLYAAGAAGILFALEHEDQTYDFLRGLPATWLPVFAGKLLLATLSAMALAGALALIALMMSGFRATTGDNILLAVGILGVAIIEAIAWGTLCSLLFRRPLVAAVVTLVVGALAVHLAVNIASPNAVASTVLRSYVTAIPLRLLVVGLVLAASVVRARSWLASSPTEASYARSRRFDGLGAIRRRGTSAIRATGGVSNRSRTSMIVRLVWQTWRESWKVLPLPIVVAACCLGVVALLHTLQVSEGISPASWVALATLFFAPALYGSFAFAADQRHGNVCFLAEHAAAPRYVWLSRHIVWLGTLIVFATIVAYVMSTIVFQMWHFQATTYHARQWSSNRPTHYVQDLVRGADVATAISAMIGFGFLAAYAIGQLCSMLLRSDVLAAFLALILAVVLSGWVAVLFVWQLSVWWFLLPLTGGLMLATWLRAPGWIAGRNGWLAWVKPALAVAATLWLMSIALPEQRLAQVRFANEPISTDSATAAERVQIDAYLKKQKSEAEATVEMYLKAAAILAAPISDSEVDRWFGPNAPAGPVPAEKKKEHAAAEKIFFELLAKQTDKAVKLAISASERPSCQFTFNLDVDGGRSSDGFSRLQLKPGKTYEDVDLLMERVMFEFKALDIAVTAPVERLLAGLRMSAHVRSGQPVEIFIRQLKKERQILGWIGDLAAAKDRTNDERREVLTELQDIFGSPDEAQGISLMNSLYAEQRLIERVILGKELPMVLSQSPAPAGAYLAYIANELPWERERASLALQLITDQNISIARDLVNHLKMAAPGYLNDHSLGRWLRPDYEQPMWMTYQPAAATSYLVKFEYNARVRVNELFREFYDTITWRRATVIKLALAMYRQDHDEYPKSLSELVPDYLDQEPLDPYSGQPFVYHPRGLDLPLRRFYYASTGFIQPHTPVFWSVGPGDDRLQRVLMEKAEPNVGNGAEEVADPIAAPAGDAEPQYVLYNEGAPYVLNTTGLIFQLPK